MIASTTLAPSASAVAAALTGKMEWNQALALTGDVTASSTGLNTGTIATPLASVLTTTPQAYGQTTAQSPGWEGTFSVPSFTVDVKGRLTVAAAHNVTIPSALASGTANGLMSSAQYNLLSASQTAKTFLAAPNGTAGSLIYRAILASDVLTLNQNTTGNAATATALATAGTISVSGTATATVGGITTSSAPTYTNGGNITINASIPAATSTTARAMTPREKTILYELWTGTLKTQNYEVLDAGDLATLSKAYFTYEGIMMDYCAGNLYNVPMWAGSKTLALRAAEIEDWFIENYATTISDAGVIPGGAIIARGNGSGIVIRTTIDVPVAAIYRRDELQYTIESVNPMSDLGAGVRVLCYKNFMLSKHHIE
ncbi:hypothetical protein AGMMS49525_03630 [Bacteroidia bacterium]|nr:hypothetical protein AGMMS49525_03630 [Bacteroidia bacterium]